MTEFKIYGKPNCPFCERAKSLLESKSIPYTYVDVAQDEEARQMLVDKKFRTVPQIYHNDWHIGGYEDLLAYMEAE